MKTNLDSCAYECVKLKEGWAVEEVFVRVVALQLSV